MKRHNSSEPTPEDRAYLIDNLVRFGIDEDTAKVISVEAYDVALKSINELNNANTVINFLKQFYKTQEQKNNGKRNRSNE